ncbi:hypothetical protein [Noviherbaspirillum sp. Root189]|uniref:hypothetical protein n=1 Tax=Noviherbaspirillum sp. Root189 TaxID=1736487 RepID=UPI0007096E5C|nr:hypothetical protein [Noviherbaspirillum sp. Root189]KRB72983.1 hypothetical protein ASE07_26950 [Noviherbaspirillum sp. Root189]
MVELRVSDGLHRRATLPLEEHPHLMGFAWGEPAHIGGIWLIVAAKLPDDESRESGNTNVFDDQPQAGTPFTDISKPVYPPAPEPVPHGRRSRWRWRGRRRVLVP